MQIVNLKDICIGKGEYGIAASAEEYSNSKYRYLRISDISDYGDLLDNDCKSVSCADCEKYLLCDDDIVFARTGNSTGRSFFYESKYGPLVYAGFLIKFHLDNSKVNPKFMKYYTISKIYKKWVMNGPVGSTRGNLSASDYADMPVFLPSRKTQDALVDTMESIDEMISNNNKICSDLEGMAKLLFDYWFIQFDFPDENGNPYKSSGGKMVWNKELKCEIPEGWKVEILDRCIERIIDHRGCTPKKMGGNWAEKGNGVMALSAKIVKNNKLTNLDDANWVTEKMYHEWMKDELIDGDILMTSEAPLGEFYFIKGFTRYCLSQRLFAIRADVTKIMPPYLFLYLSRGMGYYQIIGKQSGSTVFGIRQDELRKVKLLIPKMSIQEKFCKMVDPFYEKIRNTETENQQLTSLREFLLPMLMNGQVKAGMVGI